MSSFFVSVLHLVQETVVSEEIMHNLDTCEVTVVGDELDGEHESLELDVSQLQQRGLEMSSSNLGLVITGTHQTQLSHIGLWLTIKERHSCRKVHSFFVSQTIKVEY